MSSTTDQSSDREMALAAIHGFEDVTRAEKALETAEAEAEKTYNRMVEGEGLEGLRRLQKVCSDLKPSFKESWGYEVILQAIEDRIEDEQMVMKRKAKEGRGGRS